MADRNSRVSVKRKEKKVENKTDQDKEKEKVKEKTVKKPDRVVKKPERAPEQPKTEDEKNKGGDVVAMEGAEAKRMEENGEFEPIELPPFEIVTGWVRPNTHTTQRVTYTSGSQPGGRELQGGGEMILGG